VSAIAAPADRRFRRSHVKPSRARRRWERTVALLRYLPLLMLLGYAAHLGWQAVAQGRVLGIEHIVIRGTERLSEGDILDVLGAVRGESLVWVDLDGWRQQLLTTPWVKDAFLRRALPSTLEVVIWERRPIGIGRLKGGMYLIDDSAAIIDRLGPQHADLDLPIIDGLAPSRDALVDPARAALAAAVIQALNANADVARLLSQVDVSDLHNARVILSNDRAVISLGSDHFLDRLRSYLEMAPALRERVELIDHVDVRFTNRIYVRPVSKLAGTNSTKR
jgi:cell division protein FtsQ